MADFFLWLSSNSIAATILVIAFGTLIIAVIVIFVVAFLQGREIAFWPPKVGMKAEESGANKGKEIAAKNSADMHPEMEGRIALLERAVSDYKARVAFREQIIPELPYGVSKQILMLFSVRDSAVSERNRRKFLETQLGERDIEYGSSKGYIRTSRLTTSILEVAVVQRKLIDDNDIEIGYVVLVREDYERSNRYSHSSYIAYNVADTEDGLKIVSLETVFE